MNIINNGNSFLLFKYRLTFAAGIKNKIDVMNAIIGKKELTVSNKNLSDALFILWAGGAALLSYSLVYALRKPFTAATFDGLDFSVWTIRLQPALYRYPAILFPS